MKKLITAALIISAFSVFAEVKPAPQSFCDCTGIGIPTPSNQKFPAHESTKAPAKAHNLTWGEYLFYKAELGWWFFLLY